MFASYLTWYLLKFWILSHLLEGFWILILSSKFSLDIYSNFKLSDRKWHEKFENLQGAVWKFRCTLLKVSSSLWPCIMLLACIWQGFLRLQVSDVPERFFRLSQVKWLISGGWVGCCATPTNFSSFDSFSSKFGNISFSDEKMAGLACWSYLNFYFTEKKRLNSSSLL